MFYAVLFLLLFSAFPTFAYSALNCGGDATELLEDGAQIYKDGVTVKDRPFLTAAANGQTDLAKKLAEGTGALNETDPANGNNALLAAILAGYPGAADWISERGINLKHTNKNGQNALHLSAKSGYADLSEKLISKGLAVSGRDRAGNTPILYAAYAHNPQTLSILLSKGAKSSEKNSDNLTPLTIASLQGNTANAAVLLEAGAEADEITPCGTPLGIAIKMKNREIFDKLLEYGASPSASDLNGDTPLHLAAAVNTGMAQILLRYKIEIDSKNADGKTPLFIAVENNNESLVKILLARGANIFAADAAGNTPRSIAPASMSGIINEHLRRLENESLMLFAAVAENNITRVNQLLNGGAKVNPVDRETGNTPLFAAVANNYKELLTILAQRGADLNHRNRLGNTPLMVAVATGDDNLIETLIALGSDPNIQNGGGDTALLWAVKLNRARAAQALLAGGADANIKTFNGVTPLNVSEGEGFEEITKLLRAFGAF
jgi:ankyrin repeat protein